MEALRRITLAFRRHPVESFAGAGLLGLAGDVAFGADIAQWGLSAMLGAEWFAWTGWPLVLALLGVFLLWRAGAATIEEERAGNKMIADLRGQVISACSTSAEAQQTQMKALLGIITKTDDMVAARNHLTQAERKIEATENALKQLQEGGPARMMRMSEEGALGYADFGEAVRLLNMASYVLGENDYDGRKLDGKIRWNDVEETDAPRPQREFDPAENEAYFASAGKALADAREFLRKLAGHAQRLGTEAQQLKQGLTDARQGRAV